MSLDGQLQTILDRRMAGAAAPETNTMDMVAALLDRSTKLDAVTAERPHASDTMRSTGGVATSVGALLAAALGRPDVGTGMLDGLMKGAAARVESEQSGLDAKAEALRDEIKSGRSSLSMLFQARPESFLDAEGRDVIDPVVLGRAMTGLPIPLSAAAMVAQQKRTTSEEAIMNTALRAMLTAETQEGRVAALRWFTANGDHKLTDAEIRNIAEVAGKGDDNEMWPVLLNAFDPMSVAQLMMVTWMRGGKLRDDPASLMQYLAPRRQGSAMDDELMGLTRELTEWVNEDLPNRRNMSINEAAETMLRNDPGRLAIFKAKYGDLQDKDPFSSRQLLDAYLQSYSTIQALYLMNSKAATDAMGELGGAQQQAELNRMVSNSMAAAKEMSGYATADRGSKLLSAIEQLVYHDEDSGFIRSQMEPWERDEFDNLIEMAVLEFVNDPSIDATNLYKVLQEPDRGGPLVARIRGLQARLKKYAKNGE